MVAISVFGRVVAGPHESGTAHDVRRVHFIVESADENSWPLRYEIVAFGKIAERAIGEIKPGAMVFCAGRLSAGGPQRRVSLALSNLEVLKGAPTDVNS